MNILDPRFRYTSSFATDLRKTFARIRRRNLEGATPPEAPPPTALKVLTMTRRRKVA